MPTSLHPQAKFDPIPPDFDLAGLVDRQPNFKWVQRVSRSQIRGLRPEEFEKLVLVHVINGGKPLVIDGWDEALPKWLFNAGWFEKTYDKKQENVRDINAGSDIPMTTGHYIRSMEQLANQWTPNNFRDERRQRLYLKDIDCPIEWRDALEKVIHPNLFYLNDNVNGSDAAHGREDGGFSNKESTALAGDLMSSLPREMRAENLMCYVGHEGTYTPAHKEMCASLGQNIMVEASGSERGEKPGSSIWFMTDSKDREVVREYFLSMLGHDIEIEKHFAQVNAWKKAPFDVYVVEQRAGDFILIPPLAAHQVWNRGTRTMKVAWNRTTVETLDLALHESLPKARLVCRDEQYKNKAMIYFTLVKYYNELQAMETQEETALMRLMGIASADMKSSSRAKQLASDFKKLLGLFTEILIDEGFAWKEKEVEFLEFDSCVTCSYCRSNIFNRFLTCKHCVRTLVNGDEDAYDVCMECYAMGRSCACLSGLQWCEQWSWSELVGNYENWRAMVIQNDGYIDVEHSPQPFEVAQQRSGKKSVARLCQEALRRRPWKDITMPEREKTPSDSEPDAAAGGKPKKKKRKQKKGELLRCHVCCHKDYAYRVHQCTNPDCTEGYCYGVLYRAFDMMPQKVLEDEQWQCPKCLGICNCGHCRRAGNKGYTPKNTLLGHDTRPIADDRSVEALVDFRVHNLSWLKAAGEESRSKDSNRMKRLVQQADNAKAQDMTVREQAERAIQEKGASQDTSAEDAHAMNGNAYHSHGLQDHAQPMDLDYAHGLEHLQSAIMDDGGDTTMAMDQSQYGNPEESMYPDPAVIAASRIGLGYYEPADAPDKILFEQYQEPSAATMRFEEAEISEAVKKSIRASKRKARRDKDDPDYVAGKSHHKKVRVHHDADAEADFLDNMDPALFGAAPQAPEAVMDEPADGQAQETSEELANTVNKPERAEKQKIWYDANEPELRHAKPRVSYLDIDEREMDSLLEEEEEAVRLRKLETAKSVVDLATDAVHAMIGKTSSTPAPASVTASAQTQESPKVPKRRGRPPRSLSMNASDAQAASAPSSTRKRPGRKPRASLPAWTAHDDEEDPFDDGDSAKDDDDKQAEEEIELAPRNDGRPRRRVTGVTTIAAASADVDSDGSEDETPEPKPQKRRGRPPGRPPKSKAAEKPAAPAKVPSPSPEPEPALMSMADRMALKGKKFKIKKRGTKGTPASKSDQWPAPKDKGDSGLDSPAINATPDRQPSADVDEPEGDVSSASASTKRPRVPLVAPSGRTVVRLSDGDDSEDEPEKPSAEASSSSDDGEDIPASGRVTRTGGPTMGLASRGLGRGDGRGRGRGSIGRRARGRPRGRPRG